MADGLLRNGGYIADALPTLARLWRWHALEETEHKAVAFDVYNQVCGSRKLLRRAMINGTFFFVLDRWMWGKEGVFRPLISTYLDFFKDGFHPWEHNNLDLLYATREEFDGPPLIQAGAA